MFFVVDALDECTVVERKSLCHFFLSITNTSTSQGTIKLFITSRKEPDIEKAFQLIPTIQIKAEKVNSDIEVYVKAQIELRLQNGDLNIKDITLKDKILSALTTEARGMYVFSTKQGIKEIWLFFVKF